MMKKLFLNVILCFLALSIPTMSFAGTNYDLGKGWSFRLDTISNTGFNKDM